MSVIATTQNVRKFLVGGDWRKSEEQITIPNPYDGTAGAVFLASESDVEDAIESSVSGFNGMKTLPSYKRAEMLKAIAEKLKERKEDFAVTITQESGKPIRDSRLEVDRAVMTFTLGSEEAKRIPGDTIPLDLNQISEGKIGIIQRFPIGPVLGITGFNFPLNLVVHKVVPALAAGNSIIIKPSLRTPLTALMLGEVAMQCGVPSGALNVVPCSNELTERLVKDDRLKALSFTGSVEVGWKLKAMSGKKKVVLELGGNAAAIVDSDGNVDRAASALAAGAFYCAGQSCISVQRIFVHRSRYDEFIRKFVDATERKRIGDPMDEGTDVGPLITEEAARRIEQWVEESMKTGARVITGGERRGTMYELTILEDVDPRQKISCLEAFGPVAVVDTFDDFDEAISKVNSSDYGLQSAIFSNNMQHIMKAYRELEVGQVIVNESTSYRVDNMPYGGVKNSGFGREGVPYAIEELTEMKMMVIG